ncbi:YfiT family bacillithiol transferase [Cohnella lubricantis]|uniref:Putative metal-dependent hydrolase H4Q31_06420 n=1 Tax=Cohnella lubricantis TaxID=2163172 RepID=A0A841T6K2_9BACL|nr:bacillithiol transferase BstA [Cohnella lubricantis]MBB6676964.1 bacillithiol transferase BstA [Cohnella lubricantis]MBP2118369.1 putative damage-inducible protein DinB [Cohnella lubricantis]
MDERYPIGKFEFEGPITVEKRAEWIEDIRALPARVAAAVSGLSEEQLDTPYRDGGWTIRQVVHHIADSHSNCLTRFKLALTEDNPTIKPYEEQLWAELADSKTYPIGPSLALIEAVHSRWTALLESMSEEDYARTFYHPGYQVTNTLARALGNYSWHGRHHTAHITSLRERKGW